ncbi:hypothetical protein [Modicisalibacter sp. MOD 31.J]|uniref:hypothetical protein n=1 Tax=Modicisalibacter sp. MOD 31.J TaxID=2831897 RepID=UPI001CCE8B80|nr:hypothetical protein [Modicisalibacter sp. MOD 31.J]MBZ9574419.1 hypothetical protein [Modicisalibacter sp. MOD 31.J]
MFTLNTQRTYRQPVNLTVYDERGKEKTGSFTATFKVMPHDQLREQPDGVTLLDAVLVSVSDIEVPGPDGKALEGEELLEAVKNDPAASVALVTAYQNSIAKKNRPRS